MLDKLLSMTIDLISHEKMTAVELASKLEISIRTVYRYIDELRDNLEAAGVQTEDFAMFNITAYNRAVAENTPIITVEGWEDVHPLLKLIPASWKNSIPFGVFYSPKPTRLVKKFVDLLSSVAAK